MEKRHTYSIKLIDNVVSGSTAGLLSSIIVRPFDYARMRFADDVRRGKIKRERKFNITIDFYKKTWVTDGVAGIYRGSAIVCIHSIIYSGCYFGFYNTLAPLLLGHNSKFLSSFILAYGVTITAGLISYPVDTIRRRMMMMPLTGTKSKGYMDCISQIQRHEGVMTHFRGAGVQILRSLTAAGTLAGFHKLSQIYIDVHLIPKDACADKHGIVTG
ncbi:unnamed protein product [Rotaria sp. Silwood1]|nr:unnamed protein product [Rotaria sp. Silwood1]